MATTLEGLIHHVKLNEAGWREATQSLLLMAILGESPGPLLLSDMTAILRTAYGVSLDLKSIQKLLAVYGRDGLVRTLQDGSYCLTEVGRLKLHESAASADDVTAQVKARFDAICAEDCPEASLSWEAIEEEFLRPIAAGLGARVYDLIRGNGLPGEFAARASLFDDRWSQKTQAAVARAFERFVDPENPAIRNYFLRLLNADLLIRASSISEADLAAIDVSPSNRLSMTIFVDTNLLFSIMRLHENPADDSAEALLSLIEQLRDRLNVTFVALPTTVDEARRTLAGYADRLSKISTSPSVVAAVEKGCADVSGITLKFLRQAGHSGSRITAEEYFNPYLSDFLAVMRSFGVELHNADTSRLKRDQDVIDDILEQQQWEEANRQPERRKTYEALEHDMILWHFVKRERAPRVESPLRARAWVGTIDFRLINFDEHKVRQGRSSVPLCIHPATMLQMLQFWVPRSPGFDKALVQSLWPLLPHAFEKKAEDVTIRILSAIARFEDQSDLAEETVSNLLVNSSLRSRISGSKTTEEEFGYVESEILGENRRLLKRLQMERDRSESLAEKIKERERQVEAASAGARSEIEKAQSERDSLARELDTERAEREKLQVAVDQRNQADRQRTARRAVIGRTACLVAAEAVVAWLGSRLGTGVADLLPVAQWLIIGVALVVGVWIPAEAAVVFAVRRHDLQGSTFLKWLVNVRLALRWVLGVAVVAVIGKAIDLGFSST